MSIASLEALGFKSLSNRSNFLHKNQAMEPTAMEKQEMVSSFLEIAAGQSPEIAVQFLQATSWSLEEAIQLFYLGNEGGNGVASSSIAPQVDKSSSARENFVTDENMGEVGNGVRAPLPVKRETLYGDASLVRLQPSSVIAFRNFEEESERPAVWQSNQAAASTANGSRDNLAVLYRPPFALMYQGTFDKAKFEASLLDKWLLINLQSTEEFSSHMLNRDTWANEAVAQTIHTNFIFWQLEDAINSICEANPLASALEARALQKWWCPCRIHAVYNDSSEGKKVCTYYNLVSIPAILVIDPVTGQKMRAWSGMVQPDRLLEDLLQYMEKGPKENHVSHPYKRQRTDFEDSTLHTPDKTKEDDEEVALAMAASMEGIKGPTSSPSEGKKPKVEKVAETSPNEKPTYPPLPEEPKGSRELLCRVGVRLLDGRRILRNFLRTDPITLLWSFCCSLLDDGATHRFHFTQAIPGASRSLDFCSDQTFEEAGLANSMLYMARD